MLASVSWRGAISGAVITILLVVSFMIFAEEIVNLLLPFSIVLFAFFLGGMAAGILSTSSPEVASVTGALVAVGAGVVWMLVTFLPVLIDTLSTPSPYTRGEDMSLLLAWVLAFCVLASLGVLASYFGGRLAGRGRNRGRPNSQS